MPCRSDLGAAASSIVMAARSLSASRLIVDDRLDHCDIHTRTRRDRRYFGRHLGMLIGNGPDSRSAVSDFDADAMRLTQVKMLELRIGERHQKPRAIACKVFLDLFADVLKYDRATILTHRKNVIAGFGIAAHPKGAFGHTRHRQARDRRPLF